MGVYPPGSRYCWTELDLGAQGVEAKNVALPNVDYHHTTTVGDANQLHYDARILGGSANRGVRQIEVSPLVDFHGLTDRRSYVINDRGRRTGESEVVLGERKD